MRAETNRREGSIRSKPLNREVVREVGEVENGRKRCRNSKDEKKEKG